MPAALYTPDEDGGLLTPGPLTVGPWYVVSRLSADGFGQAESLIFDAAGPMGRAVQSLLVERR